MNIIDIHSKEIGEATRLAAAFRSHCKKHNLPDKMSLVGITFNAGTEQSAAECLPLSQMTNQRIRLAMAKLDGLEPSGEEKIPFRRIDTKVFVSLDTDYVNSHNAVQRVVSNLHERCGVDVSDGVPSYFVYESILATICSDSATKIHKATPVQKCEAVLKAKGLWWD